MELRYGILSTSSIAPRFIAGVRESGKGKIVALSSRALEKAKEKAALWNIPTAYGSHEELLQDEKPMLGTNQYQFFVSDGADKFRYFANTIFKYGVLAVKQINIEEY